MTTKDQKCHVKFTRRTYQLQCMFSIYFIFTDITESNLAEQFKLRIYKNCVIIYYNYIRNDRLQLTAFGVLEILHDTYDGRPLHILE